MKILTSLSKETRSCLLLIPYYVSTRFPKILHSFHFPITSWEILYWQSLFSFNILSQNIFAYLILGYLLQMKLISSEYCGSIAVSRKSFWYNQQPRGKHVPMFMWMSRHFPVTCPDIFQRHAPMTAIINIPRHVPMFMWISLPSSLPYWILWTLLMRMFTIYILLLFSNSSR